MNFYDDIGVYQDRVAVVTDAGKEVTYNELLKNAESIVGGIPARSLVFLVCNNCVESIAAYIGFLRARIVPVLVNPKIDDAMLSFLLESYRPQYIFCPKDWHANGNELNCFGEYHLLKTAHDTAPLMNGELAVLITTSGSTGSPKLVMQSYKNITANAASIAEYLGITKEDRAITTMPMSYTFGLSIIQSHLLMGARIVATERTLMDKGFWALLKEQQVTTFGGVPYIYEMLKRLRFSRMDLPSLK
ncbi:MAG: AMP-binding protein, partial [Clostridia bacterium]|nr:AMP-binding protein [Clostridia bacterium]